MTNKKTVSFFGQVVVGMPGAGKSTFCEGAKQFLTETGRKTIIVNLDPANESMPYEASVDIRDLLTVNHVQESQGLGPNGAMIYCLEYLSQNVEWLWDRLVPLLLTSIRNSAEDDVIYSDIYVIFDLPGQMELYSHNNAVPRILKGLLAFGASLTAVHLVDAHYCTDPSKYIAVLLLALKAMLLLELPHINVLSKMDLIETYAPLACNLEYYTNVMDLSHILYQLHESKTLNGRFARLTEAIAEVVEDFGLVQFVPLFIEDKKAMLHLIQQIDRAGGYVYGLKILESETEMEQLSSVEQVQLAMKNLTPTGMHIQDVHETYLGSSWYTRSEDEEV